ncbi:putative calmodulin-binding protein Sha1 [Aspergillus saccharolyticus JOP 1030-1]|uniref:Calponin-homology (CH) domain-containing protein n=1 Tax=Aspergillus saccharolyticus JOP 1030-1 TaxID=1450539 RepID=A0A318ZTT5_9EURO|nr:hypothetical protein BP01DRAFT_331885 [Aspergillus saccharolyticus JOP 1030-1]PYH50094.1 hypothetical protein BP01DRAFT_331885 [Aspergillus saccharolyticus JOP 1030-1]
MSSYIYDTATPCPSRLRSSGLDYTNTQGSPDNLWDTSIIGSDSTENIDFTTEIRPSVLTNAKPRRKTRSNTSFLIHDDHEVKSARPAHMRGEATIATAAASTHRKSLLAQPAQRFRPKVSFVASPQRQSRQSGPVATQQHQRQNQDQNNELLMQINGRTQEPQPKNALKKAVRRNTVYIPPDDTTVASVFMGLFSPQKTENVESLLREDTQINSLEAQIARKRQVKRSLQLGAQRAPLNPSSKIVQGANIHVDMPGKNGGKENIPPGSVLVEGEKYLKSFKTKELYRCSEDVAPNNEQTRRTMCASRSTKLALASKTNNQVLHNKKPDIGKEKPKTKPVKTQSIESRSKALDRSYEALKGPTMERDMSPPSPITAKSSLLQTKEVVRSSCVIPNDITKPELYEDDWLGHQEVILTQLMNELFDSTNDSFDYVDANKLRDELLGFYQGPSLTQLQKRLKASILYGALSLPKDVLNRASQIQRDLGLKRKFLDFWVQTYDLQTLRATLEVITGRIIPNSKLAPGVSHADGEKALKRKLAGFLDVFLLQNQDMDRHAQDHRGEDGDIAGRAYRRTLLRSIMIIVLLDKAKQCSDISLPRLLFQPTAPYKSSHAAIQALGQLLVPSCGDIIKALCHLDCQLSYEQQPLAEYRFWISNIAVDLRDGVKLARLVELLLFGSASIGEPEQQKWLLSGRLRFPCLGRAVKLHNMQLTLDTMSSIDGARKLVQGVCAEDIVDGHREKTVGLLRKLVTTWCPGRLLDCNNLRKEVHRLKTKVTFQFESEDFGNLDSASLNTPGEDTEAKSLLKQWAKLSAESNGLPLSNFSTCFSDGKIYECIVKEYEASIARCYEPPSTTLESQLQALGCSAQLVRLICPARSGAHIPDEDFTIGVLAFLCSRILPAIGRA